MGELLDIKRHQILKKPSGTIAITDNMTTVQRKFYNAFLYVAKETLKQDSSKMIFNVPLAMLKVYFDLKEDKNNQRYKVMIKKLVQTAIEWNVLDKDNIIEGVFSALPRVDTITDIKTRNIIVKFELPTLVREAMLRKDGIYANIDLVVIRGLTSKYSIILYELVKDYKNVEVPEMTIKEFKKIFGIQNKYKGRIDHLKDRVIKPALNELNNNPNIHFYVDCKLTKQGNTYTYIKFYIKLKSKAIQDKQAKQLYIYATEFDKQKAIDILLLLPKKYRSVFAEKLLKRYKNKSISYIKAQIEYTNNIEPRNYMGFLQSALNKDFAGNEKSSLELEIQAKKQEKILDEQRTVKAKQKTKLEAEQKKENERQKQEKEIEKIEIFYEAMDDLEKNKIKKEALQMLRKKYPRSPATSVTFGELSVAYAIRRILSVRLAASKI